MIYSLNNLLDWVRRSGGDRLKPVRDVLVTDGTDALELSNDGNIIIASVKLASVTLTTGDYSLSGNILTFTTPPAANVQCVVNYRKSTLTDSDVKNFILDAVKGVMAELALQWQFNLTDPTDIKVSDGSNVDISVDEHMDQTLERLIVLKAGYQMFRDGANTAAGDAILIKDGDTTIDTSKTARGNETALSRMNDEYTAAFRLAVANRQKGTAIQNNWIPLPYPWSAPGLIPGVNNYGFPY